MPAQFRVLVILRPKYAFLSCEAGVIQAPTKPRLIEGGMPTEATIASVIVSKYADHLPLYRLSQIYARQGVDIDRSTLAFWVGKAADELRPVHDALLAHLKRSSKLFMDETPAPVLDPGRGKVKKGYFWALARDDRSWNGPEPPGVAFTYAPGRSGTYASEILQGFEGILQVDCYSCMPPTTYFTAINGVTSGVSKAVCEGQGTITLGAGDTTHAAAHAPMHHN